MLRPREEVLNPDTVASFNGKTVVNEHPEGDAVHVDNEDELNCGHIQDIRQGPDLPPSDDMPEGAVTLMGDVHIKDPVLIDKVWPPGNPESGVRDISCGYSLKLKRLADGTLVMTHIRGNHVAVFEHQDFIAGSGTVAAGMALGIAASNVNINTTYNQQGSNGVNTPGGNYQQGAICDALLREPSTCIARTARPPQAASSICARCSMVRFRTA